MNMFFRSFLILFLFIPGLLFAQPGGKISGKVTDSETDDILPYAQVAVYQLPDSVFETGVITDDNGEYLVDGLQPGDYGLVITFIGYLPAYPGPVKISGKETAEAGGTQLSLNITSIDEVRVTGQAATTSRKIEKQVYNTDQFVTAMGGTAIDILHLIPSIQISPDGDVALRGTGGFLVYLNGKPTQLEPSVVLAQLPANSIEKIEIITVPTARYDAQGKGGIINILTKEGKLRGTSFTGGLMGGGAPGNPEFDPVRYSGNILLNHVGEKFSIYGGVDYGRRNVRGNREGKARILQDDGSYYWMVADGPRPEWHINWSARAGMDIDISERDRLSFGLYHGKQVEGRTAEYLYDNYYGDIDGNRFDDPRNNVVFNPNTHERVGIFTLGSIDYSHDFNDGKKLDVSFLYEKSDLYSNLVNMDISRMPENYGDTLLAYRQYDDNPLNGLRLDIDLTIPLKNGGELGFGYHPQALFQTGKFLFDTLDVNNNTWHPYTEFQNNVELTRWIHAGYIDYSGSSNKLTYSAGLRVEYTDQLFYVENADYLNIFDRPTTNNHEFKKLDFFPVLHMDWEISEKDDLIFAFSRRINRPPTKNMSPFLLRRHYEVFLVGDPSLKPEYSIIGEVSYTRRFEKSKLTLTGFYRNTDNAIYRVNTILNADDYQWYHGNSVLIRSYTNAGNNHALGIELDGDFRLTDWWKFYLGGSIYDFRIKGEIFEYQVDTRSTNWTLNTNTTFNITDGLSLYWTFSATSATVTAQGGNELFYMSDAALSWGPKKVENLKLTFKVIDMFASNHQGLYTQGRDKTGKDIFYQTVTYHRYGPIFELNLTYSLNWASNGSKGIDSEFGKEEF